MLDLVPDDREYLTGKRKQALRTNLRHARRLGLEVCTVPTFDEFVVTAGQILRGRPDGLELIREAAQPSRYQQMAYFVVTDGEGSPVAFTVAVIFGDCAVLVRSLSLSEHPAAADSRYMVHTVMRSELRSRGVRYLIAGSAIHESPGIQYFQYLLGYDVCNLRIKVQAAPGAAAPPARDLSLADAVATR